MKEFWFVLGFVVTTSTIIFTKAFADKNREKRKEV